MENELTDIDSMHGEIPDPNILHSNNGTTDGSTPSYDHQHFYKTTNIVDLLRRRYISSNSDLLTLYDHGYVNGIHRVEKESYEKYLALSRDVEHYDYQIKIYQERKNDLSNKLKEFSRQAQSHSQEKAMAVASIQTIQHQEDNKKKEIDSRLFELNSLNELILQRWPMHTFVTGMLYLIASIIFILADFVITKSIVADAMEMQGWDAIFFASALASTSFLFKPMYDRLIEKPYRANTNRIRFAVFIIILSIFVVALLAILGTFRYESYKLLHTILNIGSDPVQPDYLTGSPLNSWTALWSFILSAVIFAIAGGVSMGIGLPVINDHWQTRFLNIKKKKLETHINEMNSSLNMLLSDKNKLISFFKFKEQIQDSQNLNEIQDEIYRLDTILIEINQQKMNVWSKALQNLYTDAYTRGEKLPEYVIGTFWKNMQKLEEEDDYNNIQLSSFPIEQSVRKSERTRSRPFISLRRKIHDDYRKGII